MVGTFLANTPVVSVLIEMSQDRKTHQRIEIKLRSHGAKGWYASIPLKRVLAVSKMSTKRWHIENDVLVLEAIGQSY